MKFLESFHEEARPFVALLGALILAAFVLFMVMVASATERAHWEYELEKLRIQHGLRRTTPMVEHPETETDHGEESGEAEEASGAT